ncbi:MAG: sulfotransferase family protein, partial [Longimicrobiales bacterium]
RPIIVLGCPRSGTTILQVMLHSHHRIAIPPENRFVLPAYRQRLRFGDLEERANRRALAKFIVRRRGRRFRDLGLDRRPTIRQIVQGPPTVGSAIGIVLRAYADRFDCPRWGDKRPTYHNHIDLVMRLFPDAQIVHVVRDPRDCVASLKRMKWWKLDSHHAVSAWAQSIDHTDEAQRKWPGVVTRVQYERLVADPETELRALCAALGEEYDPAMAEPERVAAIAVPERKHWHSNTRLSPTTKPVGRWRTDLEPWEAALCETVLAGRMTSLGYELSGAGRPAAGHLARYAFVHTARRLYRRKRLLRDRWDERREPNPVAAVLTDGQRSRADL